MNNPLVNIVVTTTSKRKNFLFDCLHSLIENTIIFNRIIVIRDNPEPPRNSCWFNVINCFQPRQGIACALNAGWALAEMYNQFHEETKYFCYLQDDTIVTKEGWLKILIDQYESFGKKERISFFSGHDAPEHKTIRKFNISGLKVKTKISMRATNMIAETEYWRKLMPLPRCNPDGSVRGFPDPGEDGKRGKGSNIDVYLTGCNSHGYVEADASIYNPYAQGLKCLIIPGLVKHVGYKAEDSTWGNENNEYNNV